MAKKIPEKIETNYEIQEFETMKKMWGKIGTDICAVQYGVSANEFYETFNKVFGRHPEIFYKFNNILYIPITELEHKNWINSRF